MKKLAIFLAVLFVVGLVAFVVFYPKYDYNEEEFITALENGEDVRERTVKFEIKDIEENMMTGWTMTSQNDVLFINGTKTDDQIGDTVILEVRDYGLAFDTWIVTTRVR